MRKVAVKRKGVPYSTGPWKLKPGIWEFILSPKRCSWKILGWGVVGSGQELAHKLSIHQMAIAEIICSSSGCIMQGGCSGPSHLCWCSGPVVRGMVGSD